MGKEKRKRCADYSGVEASALVEFVATHKTLLFGTVGKGSSKEEKMKERNWKKAAAALRTVGGPEREWTHVRKKWRDLASKAKTYAAPKTGGGPPGPTDTLLERVLAVLAREVVSGILPEEDMASSQETDCSESGSLADPPNSPSTNAELGVTSASTIPARPAPGRPAAIRQCEIQEELLTIQREKLEAKEQTLVLRSISDALHELCKNSSTSAIGMLNSMQGI